MVTPGFPRHVTAYAVPELASERRVRLRAGQTMPNLRAGGRTTVMDSAEILALLARTLARGQTAGQSAGPLAARLCDACTEILGADAGILTLTSATERLTVHTAEPAFSQLEDLQMVLGEGPAALAFAEGRTVVAHLDGQEGRSVSSEHQGHLQRRADDDDAAYPVFASMAADIDGPVTVYAVPMRPSGRVVGVLTLYLRNGELARSLEEAEFLADAAGAALLGDPDTADISSQPTWPERARMHQATGVVVAQLGVAPTDALAVLRAHAFGRASTLESVVADVLERRLSFSYDEDDDDGTASDGIVSNQQPRTEEP
jgi:hypothetical protein